MCLGCVSSCRKGTGFGCDGNLIVKNEDTNGMAHGNIWGNNCWIYSCYMEHLQQHLYDCLFEQSKMKGV